MVQNAFNKGNEKYIERVAKEKFVSIFNTITKCNHWNCHEEYFSSYSSAGYHKI